MENEKMQKHKKVLPSEEVSAFCEQVALIIRSGIMLHDGMEALLGDYKGTAYEKDFKRLDETIKATGSLSEAIESAGIFPSYVEGMVRVGEQSGELERVMQGLADYYDRESKIRRTVRNAVVYPMALLVIMAVVIVILITKIMPVFETVFRNMGSELPAMTQAMMAFGSGAGKWVLAIVALVIVAVVVLYFMMKSGRHDAAVQKVFKILRPLEKISHSMSAERFAGIMSMLLAGGFPMERAIELIPDVFTNERDREKMKECQTAIARGEGFPDAVERLGLFEPLHMRMIRVGYMGGQVDSVMAKLAELYQENTDDRISRLVSMIEPTMVAVLSIIIGVILLSVMLPLAALLASMV